MGQVRLFTGVGKPFQICHFPDAKPVGSEILVRIRCCTLCRSDLHSWNGKRHTPIPGVLGHEITGDILEFGPEANRRDALGRICWPGDRITWCVTAGCGSCFFCQHGITQKCQNLRKYGHERFEEIDPYRGGLAESILLWPGTGWMKLPDPIPDEIAATLNCSVATASAALRLAGTLRNQCVVILGAGLLGLMATALAHEAGASSVIVLDPLESARSRAQEFGASHTMPPEQNLATTLVHQLTDQRGADAVLEMSGSSDAVQLGISLLRTGGTMVLAGTVSPVQPVLLDPEHIVRRMLTLRGLHNYQVGDLVTAVQFLERTLDAYPWQKLIGARFSLHEVELAFQWSIKHPGQRAAIYPLWEGLDEG